MKDTSLNENCPIKNQMFNTLINTSNSNDMDSCIFGNLNIINNNINSNDSIKTNETMVFIKGLFTSLINHYDNVTTTLINS